MILSNTCFHAHILSHAHTHIHPYLLFCLQSDNSDSEEGDEATMESLFGIEPNVKEANAPPDYEAKSGIVGLCFHPKRDLISAATMDGDAIV